MATKKYESMRIMSLEGSVVFKNDGFTATKDGKPDPKAFRGILDESLDTLKLAFVPIGTKASFKVSRLSSRMPLNALGSGLPSLVAVNPSFLNTTLPSRDIIRMLSYFFVAIVTPRII